MKNLGLLRKSQNGLFFALHIEKPSKYFAQLLESFLNKSGHSGKLLINYSSVKNGVIIGLGYESRTKDAQETQAVIEKVREFFRKFFPTRFAEQYLETIQSDDKSSHAAP